jgi:hypothetical protein
MYFNYASFEVFTTVMFQVGFFWVVTPCSSFRGHPEDGGSMDPETLVSYNTTWHHNQEDLDLNLHLRESLKSRSKYSS